MTDVPRVVSQKDALVVLEIIGDCLSCSDSSDARLIIGKIRRVLDFDRAVYTLVHLDSNGTVTDYQTLDFSYAPESSGIYRQMELHKQDPVVYEDFYDYKLQYLEEAYQRYQADRTICRLSGEFGLPGGCTSGVLDQKKTLGGLLSVAGRLDDTPRTFYILNNLTPHLHRAFAEFLHPKKQPKSHLQISTREKQVLNWVKNGKTTWDIARILSISERTVKFHIDNVMRKLDAVSRTHAVAIALADGLLDIA